MTAQYVLSAGAYRTGCGQVVQGAAGHWTRLLGPMRAVPRSSLWCGSVADLGRAALAAETGRQGAPAQLNEDTITISE